MEVFFDRDVEGVFILEVDWDWQASQQKVLCEQQV